jgi:hypothetical protein
MAVQFVDGWTGKGSITKELVESCARFEKTRGVRLSPFMAVIADPGHCASLFGTREDFLIPSACLNATVSGLVSRTVHRRDLVGPGDFHGVKFYRELSGEDVSTLFVDTIAGEFPSIASEVEAFLRSRQDTAPGISWSGMNDVGRIQRDFCIENIHFIKPGIGETTRVLLRRIPWKVLVHPGAEHLEHIRQLAEEKGVPVEPYPLSAYRCCGLIKPLNE